MSSPPPFPHGVVATPHHLASAAGQAVLVEGGNAIDAAIAANLVLAVVTPYYCGVGGDLLAMVHDDTTHGLTSAGRAPAGATPDAIRAAIEAGHGNPSDSFPGTDGMPMRGALPVTVPGAVAGWFHLLERWGSRSFGHLATAALRLATEGFEVSARAAGQVDRDRARLETQPNWDDSYGRMRTGTRFVQAELAATLRRLADDGPDALYHGPIGERIVGTLQAHGSTMTADDLAGHTVDDVGTISGRFRDADVLQLPPPTQGVTALTALGVIHALGPPASDPSVALHRQVEAVRAAMADRGEYLGDPNVMDVEVADLLHPSRVEGIAAAIDDARAGPWPTSRPAPGGTAYLCAADDDGRLVSLIQSNFAGFGSGVVVPETGIGLHDRGAHFRVEPGHPSSIGPRRRPVHTLIPALAFRDGAPWLAFGTRGGDGQPQTHLQILSGMLDQGLDVQAAIDAPRFLVDVENGSVMLESRFAPELVAGLEARGHQVRSMDAYDYLAGAANAIVCSPAGYVGASDPRSEGAVVGH